MKISVKSRTSSALILSLEGELTLNNREKAQQDFEKLLQEGKNIVVYGSDLTYVDSSGLGLFLEVNNRLKQKGLHSLAFTNLASVVKKSLEVTHLVQIMPIYNSQEEALAGFGQSWRWRVPSNPVYVKSVSNKVLECLSALNLDRYFLTEIRLCIEEAVVNAIKHGNKSDSQKLVTIDYKFEGRRLEISVGDEGVGFDTANRGKGLSLIFNFMDEVRFNKIGNTITMIKNV